MTMTITRKPQKDSKVGKLVTFKLVGHSKPFLGGWQQWLSPARAKKAVKLAKFIDPCKPSRVRFDDNVYHLKSPKREGHSQKLVASKVIGLCESLHGQDLMMTSLQKTVGWENYPNVPTSTAINDKINGEYSNILQWLFANTIFILFPRAIHLSTFALTRCVHV